MERDQNDDQSIDNRDVTSMASPASPQLHPLQLLLLNTSVKHIIATSVITKGRATMYSHKSQW